MHFGVLFPGQGSQFVGMGEALFDERSDLLGATANDVLGWSLREVCLEGPEDLLTRTDYAQPALFALSYALWDSFSKSVTTAPLGAAGHSLGEYTALAAAGSISFEEGLHLVARRGHAMAAAADIEPSGMAALIGADPELGESIAAQRREMGGRLQVANLNAPGQIVLAGGRDDIEWLTHTARDLGVRRAIPLKVAGAFHSSFMRPAAEEVGVALAEVEICPPRFPVWSNTTADRHSPGEIADLLKRQVVSPVRFSESLANMAKAGISTFIHIGPGDVTAGMAKRSVANGRTIVVSDLEDIAEAATTLGTMAGQERT